MTNYHFPCNKHGCKNMIGEKAHAWCLERGLPDLCFQHQPQHTLANVYKKTQFKKGFIPWLKGKKMTPEYRKKVIKTLTPFKKGHPYYPRKALG